MVYSEFKNWLSLNCPLDIPEQDFLEFCALCGALTIQKTIETEGLTISDLINRIFDKPLSKQ